MRPYIPEDFPLGLAAASADKPVVAYFSAPWCAPCRLLSPRLAALAASAPSAALFVGVDSTEHTEFCIEMGAKRLPHVIVFQAGAKRAEFGHSTSDPAAEVAALLRIPLPTEPAAIASTSDAQAVPTVLDSGVAPLNVPSFPGGIPFVTPSHDSATDPDAVTLAHRLNTTLLRLCSTCVSADGRAVDYSGLAGSPLFATYVHTAAALQRISFSSLSQNELKAFFLNVYNALVMHAIVVRGPAKIEVPGSIGAFFRTNAYVIGGHTLSLDDIEHGILRGNKVHPGTKQGLFEAGDVRASLAFVDLDPRIHFALVCGAKGCPPIRVYRPDNIELALNTATSAFCEDHVHIVPERSAVILSMIFKWYGTDFGADSVAVLRWILPRLNETKQAQLSALLGSTADITVEYEAYDWSINGVPHASL